MDDISFKIRKNEILGIFGKSGSGKTTLLNIISSLLVPEKGDIYIDKFKLNNDQYNSFFKAELTIFKSDLLIF